VAASGGAWKAGSFFNPNSARVVDFEQFAEQRNAGRFAWDVSTQRMPGVSPKQKQRVIKEQNIKQHEQSQRRQSAREEYDDLVSRGVIRPPNHIEKLIRTARGHEDNQSVQAARRSLDKKGVRW